MASRVLYGLASRGQLPGWLARVQPRTGTPHYATLTAGVFVLALALLFRLARLAEWTSVATLTIFARVNLALFRIKGRPQATQPVFTVPRWVPAVGAITTSGLLLVRLGEATFF
jgi:APA family basic amino acid/polyamine antiporter